MSKYVIGIDFGTESGRAVLVNVSNGKEIASQVYIYSNGVIDEKLPGSGVVLEPDWALQDPEDYIRTLQETVPAVLKESGVDPQDVIGVGIDFTACTMLPVKKDGSPAAQAARPLVIDHGCQGHGLGPQCIQIQVKRRCLPHASDADMGGRV